MSPQMSLTKVFLRAYMAWAFNWYLTSSEEDRHFAFRWGLQENSQTENPAGCHATRDRSLSSKRPDTYPPPSWRAAGEYLRQRVFHELQLSSILHRSLFNIGPNVDWKGSMEQRLLAIRHGNGNALHWGMPVIISPSATNQSPHSI